MTTWHYFCFTVIESYFDIVCHLRHLRDNLCLRGRHLVRAVGLEALRDGLRHGKATDVGGLPVFYALRHICPHYHLLRKLNEINCHEVSVNDEKLVLERVRSRKRNQHFIFVRLLNKRLKKSQWDYTQFSYSTKLLYYVRTESCYWKCQLI